MEFPGSPGCPTDDNALDEKITATRAAIGASGSPRFAAYPTLTACFAAHALLLQRGVYAPAWRRYQGDHDLDTHVRGMAEH